MESSLISWKKQMSMVFIEGFGIHLLWPWQQDAPRTGEGRWWGGEELGARGKGGCEGRGGEGRPHKFEKHVNKS